MSTFFWASPYFGGPQRMFDSRNIEYIDCYEAHKYCIHWYEPETDPFYLSIYKNYKKHTFGPCMIQLQDLERLFEHHEDYGYHVVVPKKEKKVEKVPKVLEKVYTVSGVLPGHSPSRRTLFSTYASTGHHGSPRKCLDNDLSNIVGRLGDVEVREYTFSKRMKPKVTTTIELEEV